MNENGATVFYLPRLDDDELAQALSWTFYVYDRAPRLCGWLADALTDERVRRLQSDRGEPMETELLTLPCHRWSTRELQQALTLITVMSYSVSGFAVGQLVDALVRVLVAGSGARMLRLEEECPR